MRLTRLEKERIADSKLKIQSIAESLGKVDPNKVEDFEDIQDCLKAANKSLSGALRSDTEEHVAES